SLEKSLGVSFPSRRIPRGPEPEKSVQFVPFLQQLESPLLVRMGYLANELGQVTNRNDMFDVHADLAPPRSAIRQQSCEWERLNSMSDTIFDHNRGFPSRPWSNNIEVGSPPQHRQRIRRREARLSTKRARAASR